MTQYPFPRGDEVRRVWPWAPVPDEIAALSIEGTAFHEAGHVVLLEWAGLEVSHATATQEKGFTFFDTPAVSSAVSDAPTAPKHLAGLVSIFHAGICAELIHAGVPWKGILHRDDPDWKMAAEVLHPTFGHGSTGHGYAQRLALAVLSSRWERVAEVAQEMIERGRWEAAG